MDKFDTADIRILKNLQRDCSTPLETLAENIGLSRNATWRRVKRLETLGVINARVALLDPNILDLGLMVLISVKTRHHDADWATKFLHAVRSLPEITGTWRTSGETDYVLQARVSDVAAYDRLYQRLITMVPLEDVSASFVMEEIKSTTELPL